MTNHTAHVSRTLLSGIHIRRAIGLAIGLFVLSSNGLAADPKTMKTADKPILKVITPTGGIVYTDRAMGLNATKIETMRGAMTDRVLAQSPEAKAAAGLKSAAMDTIPSAAEPFDAATGIPGKTTPANAAKTAGKGAEAAAAGTAASAPPPTKPGDLVAWAKQQELAIKSKNAQIDEAQNVVKKFNCDQAKKNLSAMATGRSSRVNEKGEVEFLNDEQLEKTKALNERKVATDC